MKEFLTICAFIGCYIVLMKWVLPRFGVHT